MRQVVTVGVAVPLSEVYRLPVAYIEAEFIVGTLLLQDSPEGPRILLAAAVPT